MKTITKTGRRDNLCLSVAVIPMKKKKTITKTLWSAMITKTLWSANEDATELALYASPVPVLRRYWTDASRAVLSV